MELPSPTSEDIIHSIADSVIQDNQSHKTDLVVIGSRTYTRPRVRDGRSKTPLRCVGSDSPQSPDRYLEQGARPKTNSHTASSYPSTTLEEDNEEQFDDSVVVTSSTVPAAIDFTRGGKRLPGCFPIYAYERNLGHGREYDHRPTPTPSPGSSPSRSQPGTPCESVIFCQDIASSYSESIIFCGEEKASTSKPFAPVLGNKKVEDLEITTETILGKYPPCITLSPNDLSELSLASSPGTGTFPTSFRRNGKTEFVSINRSVDEEYDELMSSCVSDRHLSDPYHKPDLQPPPSTGVLLEKVVTRLKQGVDGGKVHDKVCGKVDEKARGVPHAESHAEHDVPRCKASVVGLRVRAPAKVQPVNDKPARRRKSKKQRQRAREKNKVHPQGLKWWIGKYLSPEACHRAGDPPFKVSISCPAFHLPQHHCIDSVVVAHVRDHHICGCDLFDQKLGKTKTCWCVSALREITITFEIASSCHQNSNLMDLIPDP